MVLSLSLSLSGKIFGAPFGIFLTFVLLLRFANGPPKGKEHTVLRESIVDLKRTARVGSI